MFREWIPRIAAQREDVELTWYAPRAAAGWRLPAGPRIRRIMGWRRSAAGRWAEARVNRWRLARAEFDVFHSTYYGAPPVKVPRRIMTAYDFVDDETVSSFSNNAWPTGDPCTFAAWMKAAMAGSDLVVAISEHTRQLVLHYCRLSPERVVTAQLAASDAFRGPLPTAAETASFRASRGLHKDYWLYVGRTRGYKNFWLLLRAFARRAAATEEDLVLVSSGQPFTSGQKDFIIRNRLLQRIHVLAGIDDAGLRLAYAGAIAFVFPSVSEGFGIPLLEAMASGAAVIASDIPVFHEVAGDAAVYVPWHDEEALSAAMQRIRSDDFLAADLRARGQRRVDLFSWDRSARTVADAYDRVLRG